MLEVLKIKVIAYNFNRKENTLNILLNVLLGNGVSERVVNSTEKFNVNFWDLLIDSKRLNAFKNKKIQSNLKKIMVSINDIKNLINNDLINSPFILISFKLSIKDLYYLNTVKEVKYVKDLTDLYTSWPDLKTKRNYSKKISESVANLEISLDYYNRWRNSIEGEEYLNTEIILLTLFEMKKASLEELSIKVPNKALINNLNKLCDEGYIETKENVYYFPNNIFYSQTELVNRIEKKEVFFLSELLSQDIKNIDLFKLRLRGKTLQQIAEEKKVTRERIRQITKVVLDNIGESSEYYKYHLIYEKYDFSEDDFCLLFNESTEVYQYLKLKCSKGEEDPKQYILDSNISINKKIQYFEKHHFILTRNGEVKRVDKLEYFNELLFKYKDSIFTPETFYTIYQEEAGKFSSLDLKLNSSRAIEGLASRSKSVINSNHSEFRYYDLDISEENITILYDMIDLPKGLYSMNKIYTSYPDIMEDLGILNEYELHNLYKKLNIERIKLTRSPEFTVGEVEKDQFVNEILLQFSGESIYTILEHLHKEYGLRKNSILAFIQKNFRHNISNQIVYMEYEKPSEREINILQIELKKDFYLISEVEKIMRHHANITVGFSKHLMNDIGYHTSGEIVFSQKYSNVKEALSTMILKNPKFIKGHSALENSMTMASCLSQLEREYKIYRISKDVYFKKSYLETRGITNSLIESFIDSIEVLYTGVDYFSIPQIINEGFEHPLIEFGFERVFYDRILLNDDRISAISRITPMIFKISEDSKINLRTFLSDTLCDYPYGVILDDLTDDINEKYCTDLNRENVKEQLKKYGAFYSQELDKFYFYKEQYLDEVYGK